MRGEEEGRKDGQAIVSGCILPDRFISHRLKYHLAITPSFVESCTVDEY